MTSKRGLRILIVTGIFPPDAGGPATYVPEIADALSKRGYRIVVITLSDRFDHNDLNYSFRIERIRRQMFKPWRWLYTVFRVIRWGRYSDLLFVNGLAIEAALANVILRKPFVLKVVGDLAWEKATNSGWVKDNFEIFQEKKYATKVELLKTLRSWWTRRADKIIVPSRYLANRVAKWGVPSNKLAVIYNALEPLNGIKPAKVPLETPVRAVIVGRLTAWKHVDKVINAVSRFDELGLVIIGDGPKRAALEQLTKAMGAMECCYFAGQKERLETLRLIAASDFFVLNSTYEGFPHVILEAMGLGLPVVATAIGGTPEVVEDGFNGILIAPQDNRSLWEALSRLVRSSEKRQHLGDGARRTAEQFSFPTMVEKTDRLLEGIVSKTRK